MCLVNQTYLNGHVWPLCYGFDDISMFCVDVVNLWNPPS